MPDDAPTDVVSPSPGDPVGRALVELARHHAGRVIGLLASRFGDLDLAEDAVAQGLADAARTWPERGVPDSPPAWLMTVAKRNAIDLLRRADAERRRLERAAPDVLERGQPGDAGGRHMIHDHTPDPDGPTSDELDDGQLRLMLLCCHPALDRDTQVALTLRLVGGLTTTEVAHALLVAEPTMAQRIVRAKRKIRDAAIPMSIPADPGERLDAVLTVLYLVFNEGYLRHSDGPAIRAELTASARRLAVELAEIVPEHAETHGLVALTSFLEARRSTRLDGAGDLVLLEDQDRSAWDLETIGVGNAALHRAMELRRPGRFQVEATIAALHANARTAAETDWPMIASLYGQLVAMTGSPVVALNEAVALAMADGPDAGLRRLAGLEGLDDYHLRWSAEAELLLRSGRSHQAVVAFDRALGVVTSDTERRHLERRRAIAASG